MTPGRRTPADPDDAPDREAAFRLLGLARRAGRLAAGVDASRKAVGAGRARLLVVAEDGSPVQLDKVLGPARSRDVPVRIAGDRVRLGRAVGGPPLSAVAVTDEGLAEQLLRRLEAPRPGPSEPD